MEILKKILIRIVALGVFFILANYIYTKTFWKGDILEHADLLDSLAQFQNNTDVLYLSSSSNYFHPAEDKTNSTISGYISDYFPTLRLNAIHKGYMHSGVFYSILKNIPEDSPIETIIIAVNIRSFGAYWVYSDVETSYRAQQLMMNTKYPPLARRFLLALDYYDNKSKEERIEQYKTVWATDTLKFSFPFDQKKVSEWDYAIAHSGKYKNEDGSVDVAKTGYACNLVKFFAYNIDTNHVRVKDFDKIVELAKKRNWKLMFHILPEDINRAYSMIGKEIPYLLNESANLIKNRYGKQTSLFNNIGLLEEPFFYEDYPTEHYTSDGKKILAKELALQLKSIYPDEYKTTGWSYKKANISPNMILKEIKSIKENLDWVRAIEDKSKQQGRAIGEIYREDAVWALKQEVKKNDSEIFKAMIAKIKSDSLWNQNIIENATKNNISYDEQIEADAIWLINEQL